jgi:hypothetical protein
MAQCAITCFLRVHQYAAAGGEREKKFARLLKNKHQAVSQGARRFGKRSIFKDM